MIAVYFDSENQTYSAATAAGLICYACSRHYAAKAIEAATGLSAWEVEHYLQQPVSPAAWRATYAAAVSADLEALAGDIAAVDESNSATKAELESKLDTLKEQFSSMSATATRDREISDARNRIAELQQILRDRVPWIREQLGPHGENEMMVNSILNNSPERAEIRRLQEIVNGT